MTGALPPGWEQMSYPAFLEARRKAMARVIRDGFRVLQGSAEVTDLPERDLGVPQTLPYAR